MSNLQPAQFQQLQMLMKPSEMRAMPNFEFNDSFFSGDSEETLRQEKLHESDHDDHPWRRRDGKSLAQRIETEGVQEPVGVSHKGTTPLLVEGHHRYFVTERMERQGRETYLPVKHEEW